MNPVHTNYFWENINNLHFELTSTKSLFTIICSLVQNTSEWLFTVLRWQQTGRWLALAPSLPPLVSLISSTTSYLCPAPSAQPSPTSPINIAQPQKLSNHMIAGPFLKDFRRFWENSNHSPIRGLPPLCCKPTQPWVNNIGAQGEAGNWWNQFCQTISEEEAAFFQLMFSISPIVIWVCTSTYIWKSYILSSKDRNWIGQICKTPLWSWKARRRRDKVVNLKLFPIFWVEIIEIQKIKYGRRPCGVGRRGGVGTELRARVGRQPLKILLLAFFKF